MAIPGLVPVSKSESGENLYAIPAVAKMLGIHPSKVYANRKRLDLVSYGPRNWLVSESAALALREERGGSGDKTAAELAARFDRIEAEEFGNIPMEATREVAVALTRAYHRAVDRLRAPKQVIGTRVVNDATPALLKAAGDIPHWGQRLKAQAEARGLPGYATRSLAEIISHVDGRIADATPATLRAAQEALAHYLDDGWPVSRALAYRRGNTLEQRKQGTVRTQAPAYARGLDAIEGIMATFDSLGVINPDHDPADLLEWGKRLSKLRSRLHGLVRDIRNTSGEENSENE
jgi:hypothetical protein